MSFLIWAMPPPAGAYQASPESGGQQVISDVTKTEMIALLRGFGWEIDEIADVEDAMGIKTNDISSFLRLKDCNEAPQNRCQTLIFFANFDLGANVTSKNAEVINEFNDLKVMGRAYYLDYEEENEDQIGVDFRISLNGGVSRNHLAQEAKAWEDVIQSFMDHYIEKMGL